MATEEVERGIIYQKQGPGRIVSEDDVSCQQHDSSESFVACTLSEIRRIHLSGGCDAHHCVEDTLEVNGYLHK